MSNHAATIANHKRKPPLSTQTVLALTGIVAAVGLALWQPGLAAKRDSWPSVQGQISGTRVGIVDVRDRIYRRGEIDYRVEAHVIYDRDGAHHDAWLPASEIFTSRPELEFWLSQRNSKTCIVRWNPKNPDDVEAVLQRAS